MKIHLAAGFICTYASQHTKHVCINKRYHLVSCGIIKSKTNRLFCVNFQILLSFSLNDFKSHVKVISEKFSSTNLIFLQIDHDFNTRIT